ncbi:hypothetical protein P3X46_019386 [Hevea brasiliensis]|uniref:Uncharacterized protein n=1 Tax=Hevea brasiliensis TaxID=3981 RepID=A0ABQ9LIJ4_HEVBR|nr:hypothetical protein P3X46_019386 [Hevea brasiliensis]
MLTDTPPEKVARQILPWSFNFKPNEGSSGSLLFSGIMDKFAKVDDKEKPPERFIDSKGLAKQGAAAQHPEKDNAFYSNGVVEHAYLLKATIIW